MMLVNPASATPIVLSHYGVTPFGFVLKVLFALQACKFFAEGRRNGSLELLLCTPLTNREIVRGVALGLWRSFSWPLVAFFVFLFAPLGARLASAFFFHQVEPALGAFGGSFLGGIYTVRMLMDLLAVTWFGMGMALSVKKPQLAPALTILYVLILPAVLSMCFLDVVPDVFFIIWGMTKSRVELRHVLVQQYREG
jgi:ABC-type transport system involved in multi-copper enzyme maturation permease subunit